MFPTKNAANLSGAWRLSNSKDNRLGYISEETTKCLRENDVLAVEFLYKSIWNELNGVILNEEQDMNMCLQVSAFFNALSKAEFNKFLVLVIVPDDSIIKWHYHLSVHAELKVKVVTADTCPTDIDEKTGLALLLQFSDIKLAERLVELDYFSVVIDAFDTVAAKLIVKKLYGKFNIGLSERNFYTNPDQKLQWNMLNWSNPGCVGKLADFYEIDNDNFANFRNNYRYWWFRLTWSFCESFKKPSEAENQQYEKDLKEWAQNSKFSPENPQTKIRKRKAIRIEGLKEDEVIKQEFHQPVGTRTRKTCKKRSRQIVYKGLETKLPKSQENLQINNEISEPELDITKQLHAELNLSSCNLRELPEPLQIKTETTELDLKNTEQLNAEPNSPNSSQSSEDTIIYENEEPNDTHNASSSSYIKLPSMDETPIVCSIIRTLENSPSPIKPRKSSPFYFNKNKKTELTEAKNGEESDDSDILLSIINSTPLKRENKMVEVDDNKVTIETDEPGDFFQSLMAKKESKNDSDNFLQSFVVKSQHLDHFSQSKVDDFTKNEVDDIGKRHDASSGDAETESDDFLKSLVNDGKKKSSEKEIKTKRNSSMDVDVEEVLKNVDEILNST